MQIALPPSENSGQRLPAAVFFTVILLFAVVDILLVVAT
jgi:hypothetical protein